MKEDIEEKLIEKEDNNNKKKNKEVINDNKTTSIASETVEDNITKKDTNATKKEHVSEEEVILYEGDKDLESNKQNNNIKTKTNKGYHFKINKNCLKYSTLIIIILYIILILASCIIFHMRREKFPFLFCFEFIDRFPEQSQDTAKTDIIYFLTDLTSFYILHLVLLFLFSLVVYLLIKGEKKEISLFFNDMSIFLISTLLFNIPIFFLGMNAEQFYGNHLQPIAYLALTFFGLLSMIKIYIVAKRHTYTSVSSLLNTSVLTSFMTAFQCYSFIFCLIYFIMNFFKPKINVQQSSAEIEIILGCIYLAIGIVVITVFKDIFFNIAMVIIENGLLYAKRNDPHLLTNLIFNISIVAINFASIIIVIFAYNKKVFRLKKKEK